MDVVHAAAAGTLSHRELVELLSAWEYVPRERIFGAGRLGHVTEDSLDAVDEAYFQEGLLAREEYIEIVAGAAR